MSTKTTEPKKLLQAVLTADIVNSTLLASAKEKKLLKLLENTLQHVKHEFFRGDSFQAIVKPGESLQTALMCRALAISINEDTNARTDVRISIGIGKVNTPVKTLNAAKGEAFLLSGRQFDEMPKNGPKLIITTYNETTNIACDIIAHYADSIFNAMTAKQAYIIAELLAGHTQYDVAEKLKKSKSTISQHADAGNWKTIAFLIEKFQQLTAQL
jgi:hypothetical protein